MTVCNSTIAPALWNDINERKTFFNVTENFSSERFTALNGTAIREPGPMTPLTTN
jgi:hypothetical protein